MEFNRHGSVKIKILCFFIITLCIISFAFGSISNAANSSTALPISRGGTGAKTASEAATNILGDNFANYNGILPIANGGTGANNQEQARKNLNIIQTIQYSASEITNKYVRIGVIPNLPSSQGDIGEIWEVDGLLNDNGLGVRTYISATSRTNGANKNPLAVLFMTKECLADNLYPIFYVNIGDWRYFYSGPLAKPNPMSVQRLREASSYPGPFEKETLSEKPDGAVQVANKNIYCLAT
ncbi:MAG: hypothetical protein LBT91_02815 [Bifidobacteriaceae bacterium]|jgi:hypothetical protein|nr:hypothetical protein [Bifidobacteriaceae bacterium]